jgi:hypothetical protein
MRVQSLYHIVTGVARGHIDFSLPVCVAVAFFALSVQWTMAAIVIGWGDNNAGESTPPAGLQPTRSTPGL